MRDDEQYSILPGCCVSPWARSILTYHVIDGLMLDTTWRVLRQDVAAIVMAVYGNVGIPLGFAFGVAETIEPYEQHYTALADLFGIQLAQYTVESDRGSALCGLCARHRQTQLFCLRHFLLSRKLKEFSFPVANLVKCRTSEELETLKNVYEVEFSGLTDGG
jgi:hypothetical protein